MGPIFLVRVPCRFMLDIFHSCGDRAVPHVFFHIPYRHAQTDQVRGVSVTQDVQASMFNFRSFQQLFEFGAQCV